MRKAAAPYCLWMALVILVAACGSDSLPSPSIEGDVFGWPDQAHGSDAPEPELPPVPECTTDEECLPLDDGDLCNGTLVCVDDRCVPDPDSVVTCPPWEGMCAVFACNPETGSCEETPLGDGEPCDDGDACTVADTCFEGACVGKEFKSCDDGNPCTADLCVEGECTSEPVSVSCEDDNPCTTGDECVDGACVSGSGLLSCDDGNPCTDDACSSVQGCVHQNNEKKCDDGDPCSLGDQCAGGLCVPGPGKLKCDDGNPCTDDVCIPGEGCTHTDSDAECDAGPCTLNDHCVDGVCVAGEPDPACSCVTSPDCMPYEDGDLCDGTLICVEFQCVVGPGTVVDCSGVEAPPCHQATCAPDTGECVPLPIADDSPCDDGDPCTEQDSCLDGECGGSPKECDDSNPATVDWCDEESGECLHQAAECDDGNPCTQDLVDADGVCYYPPVDCKDDEPCTVDSCDEMSGECLHAPVSCDNLCLTPTVDPATGECGCLPINCDDGNACTTDGCKPAQGGCVNAPVDCDDDDPTTEDSCDPQTGCVHQLKTCNDNDLCTEDSLDPATGECTTVEVDCDDGNLCTEDSCDPATGGCVNAPVSCDDGNACTGDSCNPQTGSCMHAEKLCTDANPCTADSCHPATGECVFDPGPMNLQSCTDGDDCTFPDLCMDGECLSGPDVCIELCHNKVDDDGDGLVDCKDPDCAGDPTCKPQECKADGQLSCGSLVVAQIMGNQQGLLDNYPCVNNVGYTYPGKERIFTFTAPCTGKATFTVSGQMTPGVNTNFDIFILDGACSVSSCIAAGLMGGDLIKQAVVTFDAQQGKSYYVIVEGRSGATGSFSLMSSCNCWGIGGQ
jgi:hypothetical protein